MAELIRITDDTTDEELAEALRHLLRRAKREMPVVGSLDYPTPWDRAHYPIDALLDEMTARRVEA